jgi:Holliday junction resolvase RusA-like endonuclease
MDWPAHPRCRRGRNGGVRMTHFATKDLPALRPSAPAPPRRSRKAGTTGKPAPEGRTTLRGKQKAAMAPTPGNWTPVRLTLPYPPSANRYWRKTKHGRVYVSEEAKAYKSNVATLGAVKGCRPLTGDVAMILIVYRPQKSGDLSNRIKVLEDALIGVAFADDKQVTQLVAQRRDDKANPRVEVDIRPAVPWAWHAADSWALDIDGGSFAPAGDAEVMR